jgi:VPDSG-CTERM motif
MNKTLLPLTKLLAGLALIGAAATGARADSLLLDVSQYGDLNGYGGGEFTAITDLSTSSYAASTLIGGGFETFCMAYSEEFVPNNWGNSTPFNFTLGNQVLSNPTGAVSSTLTEGTAWLYSQFASGTLADYNYSDSGGGTSRAGTAEELQIALWWLQQSPGAPTADLTFDNTNPFETMVVSNFGSIAGAMTSAPSDYDGVQIMVVTNPNPADGSTPYAQPQLYYNVPDNGTTVALLGIALVGMVLFKRRLKAVSQS